jgi:hypothetical protein
MAGSTVSWTLEGLVKVRHSGECESWGDLRREKRSELVRHCEHEFRVRASHLAAHSVSSDFTTFYRCVVTPISRRGRKTENVRTMAKISTSNIGRR